MLIPDIEISSTVALIIVGMAHVAVLTYVLGGIRTLLAEHGRRLDKLENS